MGLACLDVFEIIIGWFLSTFFVSGIVGLMREFHPHRKSDGYSGRSRRGYRQLREIPRLPITFGWKPASARYLLVVWMYKKQQWLKWIALPFSPSTLADLRAVEWLAHGVYQHFSCLCDVI